MEKAWQWKCKQAYWKGTAQNIVQFLCYAQKIWIFHLHLGACFAIFHNIWDTFWIFLFFGECPLPSNLCYVICYYFNFKRKIFPQIVFRLSHNTWATFIFIRKWPKPPKRLIVGQKMNKKDNFQRRKNWSFEIHDIFLKYEF